MPINQPTYPSRIDNLVSHVGAYTDAREAAHNAATTAHGKDMTKVVTGDVGYIMWFGTEAEYNALPQATRDDPLRLFFVEEVAGGGGGGPVYKAQDTFNNRTEATSLGNIETPAGLAYTYNGGSTDWGVNSGVAAVQINAAATDRIVRIGINELEQIVLFKWRFSTSLPTGSSCATYVAARMGANINTDSHYRVRLVINTNGSVQHEHQKVTGGSAASLNTPFTIPSLTLTADTWYYTKFQATGTNPTTLNSKTWLASGTEPGSWHVTNQDSSSPLGAGGAGFGFRVGTGVTNVPRSFSTDIFEVT